jgi:hypothetical protein
MDEAPKLHHVLVPVILGGLVGIAIGIYLTGGMVKYKHIVVVICFVSFSFVGWQLSRWFLNKRKEFHYYEYDMSFNSLSSPLPEMNSEISRYLDIKLWTSETSYGWLRLGITDQQWHELAVIVHNAQAFSTNILDRELYGKLRQKFLDKKLIEPKGSGYELTRAGKSFFKYIAALPYPFEEEPDLIKILE